ncbi:MAG: DUF4388 domain-containing protein [Kofleriaceae bacterium]|nr:DUF4388 domain-containing protein [Kofleriaceae bacterium]
MVAPPGAMTPEAPPVAAVTIDDRDIVDVAAAATAPPAATPPELADDTGDRPLPPGVEAPVLSETHGSFDGTESTSWPLRAAGESDELPAAAAAPPAAVGDGWDTPPPMPAREPTLILTDGAAGGMDAGDVAPVDSALDLTERHHDGAWSAAPSVTPVADDEPERVAAAAAAAAALDDLDAVEDHLDADLAGLSVSRPVPAPPASLLGDAPPSGGDFARELRRKMSLMAQRLFRQTDLPVENAVDVAPHHDFRTEIDLAEIDEAPDGGGGGGSGTEVYELGGATFAGDDHGLPTSPGVPDGTLGEGSARSTAEAGELVRGVADAAVLIARMFVGEFTGKIVFTQGAGDAAVEKAIYFDGGRPVFASSNLAADRMGELLYREGKITAEQYAGCRDLVSESGRRMGEILVDRGFLKRRELLPAVRRHVEDIIYSLFAWDEGSYRVVPGDGAASERIRLSRHPAAMVLEGVRRKLDPAVLERLLGPPGTVVEVADRDKAGTMVSVADLSSDERGVLAAMDGTADLAALAEAAGAGLVSVYQLAWSLVVLGVATVRRRGGDDDAPALVGETDLAIDRERVRARHRLVDEADYFALLGVRRDATGFEIKRAYEAARRDFDADAFPPELRAELAVELAEIESVLDEAFRVLRDDGLRGHYLEHLRD